MKLETGDFPTETTCPYLRWLRKFPFLRDGRAWVAGGAVRYLLGCQTEPRDIDIFFRSAPADGSGLSAFDQIRRDFEGIVESPTKIWRIGQTSRGVVYRVEEPSGRDYTFQFISMRGFEDERDLINSIDYTVCRGVTDGYRWIADARMRPDIKAKRLVVVAPSHVEGKVGRFMKYVSYGYTPVPGMITEVMRLCDPKGVRDSMTQRLQWNEGISSS